MLAVVQRLLEAGAEQGQIGIICLFRAQASCCACCMLRMLHLGGRCMPCTRCA